MSRDAGVGRGTVDGTARAPGDALMRIGVVIAVAGLVFTLVAMVPLVVPAVSLPPALWFLAMLTGVGLLLVMIGLLRSARARGRAMVAAAEPGPGAEPDAQR